MTTCRTTLIEPLVEPAEALTNMSPTSVSAVNDVHWLKSAVAKPVVVIIETAWLGGGVVGFVFGSLFVLAGAGRLWLHARQ